MLAQYLVSLRATNLRESKIKSVMAVNSPQNNKERTFHVHLLVESDCIALQKYILRQGFRLSLVLNLFLSFHHISGLYFYKNCSYKNNIQARERPSGLSLFDIPLICHVLAECKPIIHH